MRFLCIYFYICILCGVSFSIFQVTSLGISRPSRERSRDGLETIFQVMSLKKAYSICKGSSIGFLFFFKGPFRCCARVGFRV